MSIDLPLIQLDGPGPDTTVVDGAGWIQTTPVGRGDRTYRDTALGDDRWPATAQTFTSLTAMLGRGIPSDWTGPTKWNVARYADAHFDQLTIDAIAVDHGLRVQELCANDGLTVEEACRQIRRELMVDAASTSLDEAADRGSACHRAMEALLLGVPVDRDDLRRHGALPYLLAIERFLVDAEPVAQLLEVVCFDRELGVAGTVDFVGTTSLTEGTVVLDWKTRTKSHDRRAKEAAQVAGYARMLTEHYFMDGRGDRRQCPVDGAGVVTFAPDGTWALHPVDLVEATEHYRRAVDMARANLVSGLYGRARRSEVPDVNAIALARIAAIPEGTVERAQLAAIWAQAGLGAASLGQLGIEDWPLVDDLLATAEARFRPFPACHVAPTTYATTEQVAATRAELVALPSDLRAQIAQANAPLFRRLETGIVTAEDDDDLNRLIGTVAEIASLRQSEVRCLLDQVAECSDLERALILGRLSGTGPGHWTDTDVERVATLLKAVELGWLVADEGGVTAHPAALAALAAIGKRDACTAARPFAELFGRPVPRKWDDLVADPLLFAAVASQARIAIEAPETNERNH